MEFHHKNQAALERVGVEEAHIIWLKDFNQHYPY